MRPTYQKLADAFGKLKPFEREMVVRLLAEKGLVDALVRTAIGHLSNDEAMRLWEDLSRPKPTTTLANLVRGHVVTFQRVAKSFETQSRAHRAQKLPGKKTLDRNVELSKEVQKLIGRGKKSISQAVLIIHATKRELLPDAYVLPRSNVEERSVRVSIT